MIESTLAFRRNAGIDLIPFSKPKFENTNKSEKVKIF